MRRLARGSGTPAAAITQTRPRAAVPHPQPRSAEQGADRPYLAVGPCASSSLESRDINILLLTSQIKHRPCTPSHDHTLELKVTFCVRGAISPLLANIYLHDFDRAFHEPGGPAQFANARLVRYADDFVVLARWMGPRLVAWLEWTLEQDLGLTVNRTKTRVVCVSKPGASLDFLGFTLRYDRDLHGRNWRYLNVTPSTRAVARLRAKLRGLTSANMKASLPDTVAAVNTLLRGWTAYFRYGYPRRVFRVLNHYLQVRFRRFLRNRSQRRSRPFRAGESLYAGLHRYGLRYL